MSPRDVVGTTRPGVESIEQEEGRSRVAAVGLAASRRLATWQRYEGNCLPRAAPAPTRTAPASTTCARYYDSTTGRLTQVDPIVNPLDPKQWNRYVYVGDDPVNFTDLNGLGPAGRPTNGCSNANSAYYKSHPKKCGSWDPLGDAASAVGDAAKCVGRRGEVRRSRHQWPVSPPVQQGRGSRRLRSRIHECRCVNPRRSCRGRGPRGRRRGDCVRRYSDRGPGRLSRPRSLDCGMQVTELTQTRVRSRTHECDCCVR